MQSQGRHSPARERLNGTKRPRRGSCLATGGNWENIYWKDSFTLRMSCILGLLSICHKLSTVESSDSVLDAPRDEGIFMMNSKVVRGLWPPSLSHSCLKGQYYPFLGPPGICSEECFPLLLGLQNAVYRAPMQTLGPQRRPLTAIYHWPMGK